MLPRSRHSTFQEGPESKTASGFASMALALQLSTRIPKQCKAKIVQYSCVCVIHKESMQLIKHINHININDICQLLPFQVVHFVLQEILICLKTNWSSPGKLALLQVSLCQSMFQPRSTILTIQATPTERIPDRDGYDTTI